MLIPALLWLVAAAYFLLGSTGPVEWVDEGQFVYLGWRVAEGELPYRDFIHTYAPSMFFLNGALFRLFGADLLVVRLSLVVVKATLALCGYLLAQQVGGRIAALLASALMTLIWGSPIWFFSTPYASIYQVTLDLAAVVAYLGLGPHRRAGVLVAGLLLGAAATFKQTTGILVFASFLVLLLHESHARRAPAEPGRLDAVAPGLALLVVGGALALCAQYVTSFAAPKDVLILAPPVTLLTIAVGWRTAKAGRAGAAARLVPLLWAGLGFAVVPAIYAATYLRAGALGELVRQTLWGLPQELTFLVPMPRFNRRALIAVAALALLLAAARLPAHRERRPTGRAAVGTFVVALVVLIAAAAVDGSPAIAWRALRQGGWHDGLYRLLAWLPAALTWAAALRLLLVGRTAPPAFAAVTFVAAAGVLVLQPAGDLPHVLLALPMFVPLLGWAFGAYLGDGGAARPVAAAVVVALLAAPFVQTLADAARRPTPPDQHFRRATGLRGPQLNGTEVAAVLRFLEQQPAGQRLLALPTLQMLAFLAGRPSALERAEFPFYLAAYAQVADAATRALVDQDAAIARLEAERPLVVWAHGGSAEANWRRVFDRLASHIDGHYERVAAFGHFEVLAPRDAKR